MVTRYVSASLGNDAWDGLSPVWTAGLNGPKATLNGAEDTPVVAGDLSRTAIGTYSMEYTIPSYSGGAYYYKLTVGGTYIGVEQSSFDVRVDETA